MTDCIDASNDDLDKKETEFEVCLEEFKSNIWVVLPGEAN